MKFIQFLKHVSDQLLAFIALLITALTATLKRLRWIPVAAALGLLPIAQTANAQDDIGDPEVWLVDGIDGDDMSNGKNSWANARKTIQSVLNDVTLAAGDRIWVAATTTPYTTGSTFSLEDGVWLLGGFAGTESNQFQADPHANETILTGTGTTVTAINISAALTRLDGFTITGDTRGLRVVNDSFAGTVRLNVTRCRFIDNGTINSPGGAVALIKDSSFVQSRLDVAFTNCEFVDNLAANGGAIFVQEGATVTVTNSLFVGNDATSNGGAIYIRRTCEGYEDCGTDSCFGPIDSRVNLNSCTFFGNDADVGGAAWVGRGEEFRATGCIFWGNTDDTAEITERKQIAKEYYCDDEEPDIFSIDHSTVQGLSEFAGSGNIGADPLFAGAPGNLRLGSGSPCVDEGDVGFGFPQDDLDFDHDTNTNELAPDLDRFERIIMDDIDMAVMNASASVLRTSSTARRSSLRPMAS